MSQIKSKDRVRDLAEVYTNEREVNAMLDLIPLNVCLAFYESISRSGMTR
jgi:hypothetical protein